MKKVLSLLLVCMCAFSAMALEKTFTASTDLVNGTVDGFTFLAEKNNGTTAPTYNANGQDVRIYAKGTYTITNNSGTNMTNIVFNISTQGKRRLTTITPNTGAVAAQALGDETVTWNGAAQTVAFTVGDQAIYGTDGESKAGQLCFTSVVITYEDGGTVTIPAPQFNPAGGTFYAPVNVEITAATGATIYYTTNGNDPTTSSAVYSAPINISQNTTLKAIAVTEDATSAVASATYTFESVTTVDNIAAYYALGTGAFAAIGNPVTVYYRNGNNVWVKDETGYLLIYGKNAGNMGYENGDIIPGGFGGYLKSYNGLLEMSYNGDQDLFGFQEATSGPAINPETATTADVVEANFGHYVTISNATISDVSGKNFTITDAAGTVAGFNNNYSGITIPTDGGTYNITGIIITYVKDGVTTMQLQPTAFEKVVNIDDLPKVDNIAGLLATAENTDVMFNNPVTAVYQSGNQLYINDASGFMLVYGHLDTQYTNGDQINGIAGSWKLYNGMSEMVPIVSTFTEGTAGTPVQPALITIEEIDQSMIHNYLRIENVTLAAADTVGRNFTMTDETGEMIMRLNFTEVTIGEDFDYDATYNVEGFLAYYKKSDGTVEQLQFYPNLIQKVGGTVVVPGDVDGDDAVTAGDVTALYNYILNNDSSSIVNGDQDGDGSITAGDVTFVYNILLGSK